ncbi:MAG: TniB family NTP-binding protein, partial [Pseudonocardiaceae bacterium]
MLVGETRPKFLNLIRFLGNELDIPLVGVSTREAYLAIRADDQLENRFEPFVLLIGKPARCGPASPPRSRCIGHRRSPLKGWPTICSP